MARSRIRSLVYIFLAELMKGHVLSVDELKHRVDIGESAQPSGVDSGQSEIPYSDRRAWMRWHFDGQVVANVYEIAMDTAVTEDRELSCQAIDASAQGFQFKSDLEIPVGAVLDFVVQDPRKQRAYTLTGEVRWVRPTTRQANASNQFLIGVSLYDGSETDIRLWQKRFAA